MQTFGKEDIFNPKIGNESLHENSNDNVVGEGKSASSKNLAAKNTISCVVKLINSYNCTSVHG
jgi:hypothetical protein